jgi:acyl-coenzyme A synthetase/AMP-(fatty) acid ligase
MLLQLAGQHHLQGRRSLQETRSEPSRRDDLGVSAESPYRLSIETDIFDRGSMSHIAQTFMLIGALHNGACVLQTTRPAFSSDEMLDMVTRCGLNCIRQFGTFLSIHINAARYDSAIMAALRSMDEVFYCGIGLLPEDEAFALKNGIKLRNVFGSTEVGALLYTADGDRFLQQLPGTKYAFLPMKGAEKAANTRNPNARLLELVVLSESDDCPHRSLCSEDGNYRTGDLFQQVQPGRYIFRGRDDDWIKSENSLRCDTK